VGRHPSPETAFPGAPARWKVLAGGVVVVVLAAACGGRAAPRTAPHPAPRSSVTLAQVPASPVQQVPSALDDPVLLGLPRPLIDPAELRSGGPRPDGIPPLDHPRFQRASEVDWLRPGEPVLAATVNGEDRAYPVQILIWHEIVNDTVGGIPVAVTYCPLCNTAIAYDRRVGSLVLDFGTSGKLYNSDLVAYDRQTQSLWVQFLGQAVAGTLTGARLQAYPLSTISWGDWRRNHADGWVLSRDTGYSRRYGDNPYPGYDDVRASPFLFSGKADGRLAAMERVVGLDGDGDPVAVDLPALRRRRVVEVDIAGKAVTVWQMPGTASALADATVAGGPDVGATGAFVPVIDGRVLHFAPTPDGFKDRETSSTWDILGHSTGGPLVGRTLPPVLHVDTFWFAWAVFRPSTRLVSG